MTKNQLARIGKDLAGIAGEPVEVEEIKGVVYVFGSELATLRLLLQYRNNAKARVGHSIPRESHYFSLELSMKYELNFDGQKDSCATENLAGQESELISAFDIITRREKGALIFKGETEKGKKWILRKWRAFEFGTHNTETAAIWLKERESDNLEVALPGYDLTELNSQS